MATTEIIYAVQDGVAVVTLNRPDKLNAWTPTMEREVREAMRLASDDDAVRVIVLTGAGRGFCAGGMPKGESLRLAQEAMLSGKLAASGAGKLDGAEALPGQESEAVTKAHGWSHPFYWAPFILIGNWK